MRGKLTLLAGVCAAAVTTPSFAQSAQAGASSGVEEIIVTAQRQSQRLQDVPIAVSAFTAEGIEKQQIKNTSDLQLTLPNVTFTKTNFSSASFTIRGIGDLCVGVTCDSATAIHLNDAPLGGSTRLFEGEFYDLAQIEVLRGPQGTLFGRNATSGVVNFRTAKPDLNKFGANGEAEYGNYNSIKVKGALNVPLSDTFGVRLAGFYLDRDGYTKNLYDNSRIDDRHMFGLRGSVTWEPTPTTTVDFMAQYFKENDNRLRIQKQLCDNDPTGILGCLNTSYGYGTTNANSTAGSILISKQFLALNGLSSLGLGLTDVYGKNIYQNVVNPTDPRVVNTDYKPYYKAEELILQGRINQKLGDKFNLRITGQYSKVKNDSGQDYNLSVGDASVYAAGLARFEAAALGAYDGFLPGFSNYIKPAYNALLPKGLAGGTYCTSLGDPSNTGVYGGHALCASTPEDFDRSTLDTSQWSAEAVLTSDFDGPFNFLLGGIYSQAHVTDASYYVNSFQLDYASALLGAATAYFRGLPPSYMGSPNFHSDSTDLRLKSYGLFGEGYVKFSDKVKLTVGLRLNHDDKKNRAATTLLSALVPYGTANFDDSPYAAGFDGDPSASNPGVQRFQERQVKFTRLTGRAVLDFQITPDNLLYASYSRGYKSGGINPPLSAEVAAQVPETFKPESVNAFEIGSKNTFANGAMQLNVTAFYYKYKQLQLSRIVNRTSVNDNIDADIWGVEAEAVFRPSRDMSINANFSYLNTKVTTDKPISNSRDYGGGRADAVIIKDLTTAANCAVASKSGNAAITNAYVNAVNDVLSAATGAGLQHTTTFPSNGGIASTGAFSVCSAIASGVGGVVPKPDDVVFYGSGVPSSVKGNHLPGAPTIKFSAGVQYDFHIGDLTLTPRADLAFTGESYGNIFNGNVNKVPAFTQVNAQIQLDGPDKKWFIRGFVQNLTNNNSITGLYVTDQSSGLFTNIFTLEPRRYGVAAGFRF
ncbi:TonB-dependent receptor [Novosphingobium olei]|uniref:TonB-dependent receptor n=1 Tax=Novosphingobium olei TaxID=2728851 RepID=A0A7Y0BNJ8_9SPHN|nr:TonB-dependent receptor [Novosphingobium olei]NML93573.1 TonB-dependent receptor [Novosphingobium olei]BEV00819.1 TonB-dependent receptor [Novosphingobium olei]